MLYIGRPHNVCLAEVRVSRWRNGDDDSDIVPQRLLVLNAVFTV